MGVGERGAAGEGEGQSATGQNRKCRAAEVLQVEEVVCSPLMPVRVTGKACFPFVRRSCVECKWNPATAATCVSSERQRDLEGHQLMSSF